MTRYVQIVSWGEDYTVQAVDGIGSYYDFEAVAIGVGDLAPVLGPVDKVRLVDGYGETPRYRVRLMR